MQVSRKEKDVTAGLEHEGQLKGQGGFKQSSPSVSIIK